MLDRTDGRVIDIKGLAVAGQTFSEQPQCVNVRI